MILFTTNPFGFHIFHSYTQTDNRFLLITLDILCLIGLLGQEKKRKIDFKMAAMTDILDFDLNNFSSF